MNNEVRKALNSAEIMLKGGASAITANELEDALFKLADDRRHDDETGPQAFARLAQEGDSDVMLIYKALDQLRVAAQQPDDDRAIVKSRLHQSASELIDQHVAKSRRPDESTEQATARLARDRDPTFIDLYAHLRAVQGL